MQIIDTHAHLDHAENIQEVLKNASDAGVVGIVAVSEDLETSKKNLEFSKSTENPKIYLAMGMHPSEANVDEAKEIVELIKKNRESVVAIGEVGLDYWYKWVKKDADKKNEQIEVFEFLVNLAKELDLPITIHSRGAWKDCLDTVKKNGLKDVVFHWYSGPIDVLDDILAQGYYISATPSLAYSPQAQDAVKHAPIEKLLIETDSPVYYRNRNTDDKGFRAEPKDVIKTLKLVSDIKGINEQEVLEVVNNNAKYLFRIKD